MPKQKDLKRLIRVRMQKTGEAYTAARLQVLQKPEFNADPADLAKRAGMSDASIAKATGRGWAEWVKRLDRAGAVSKPHREIVAHVSSLGVSDWWAQGVTVGYERIRGLRDRGQRRGGGYEANKSRTFQVPVEELFEAFANARKRRRWLPAAVTVKSSTPPKYMRMTWTDGRPVVIGFLSKGTAKSAKSMVAITHEKLPDKSSAEAVKKEWAGLFDRLGELLS
jgi:hypothetical protein